MKKYIYMRSSLDWGKLKSIDDYLDANRDGRPLMKKWLPRIAAAISEWDSAFNIKYFEFRERMKNITLKNISKVKDAIITNRSEKKFCDDDGDFVIYPIDDDDWVWEDIFFIVCAELNKEDDLIAWPFGFFRSNGAMKTDIEKPIDDIKWVYSNNAAITRRGYQKFCDSCVECDFLEDHREADELCHKSGVNVRIINKTISAYNHSPASATKLWGLTAGNKNEDIYSLLSNYDKLPHIPEELAWSVSYAEEMWQLISELRRRRVFI
jgi:hypothetical protein